jgi:hypothetical protein
MPDLILNELSFQDWDIANSGYPCRDRQHARQAMGSLVSTLRETARFPAIRPELRTQHASLEYPLAEGYSVSQWRNDPEVNRDERVFLRGRTTIAYSLEDALSDDTISEVSLNGRTGFGLSAAWLLGGVCLSLASNDFWNRSLIQAEVTLVSEGDTVVELAELRHASHPSHILDHEEWLERTQRSALRTGADVIAKVPALYPNVELGLEAHKAIAVLSGTEKHFGWVIDCLESANQEILAWTAGPFPHHRLPGPATGESLTVRQSKRLMKMREFPSSTGEPLQFEHHMKARGSNIRMYYRAETDRRVVLIGTLCDHLETAKY